VEIQLPMFNVEIQLHIGLGSVPYLPPPSPALYIKSCLRLL